MKSYGRMVSNAGKLNNMHKKKAHVGAWAQEGDVSQGQRHPYRNPETKSTLKIVAGGGGASTKLRLGGLPASEEMRPGEYKISCEAAWLEPIGKGSRAVLQFRVIEGPHTGTALRQWLPAAEGGIVAPLGRYAKHCALALGRELTADEDLDPAKIFVGRIFQALIGFRKTERRRGGMASDSNAGHKKDDSDYLRVHELIELVEL
jgi:hypothetical protein